MKKTPLKLSFIVILTMIATTSFAQVKWGVRAGANFTNSTVKAYGIGLNTSVKPGFHLGMTLDIPLKNDLYLQQGLLYSQKGYKVKENIFGAVDPKQTEHLNYIELPLHLIYKPVTGNGRLLLGAGAYLAYGISGKSRIGDVSEDVEWGKNKDYSPFDAGVGFLAGYELSTHLSIQLNAQLGIVNGIGENPIGANGKYKNNLFSLSVGYQF